MKKLSFILFILLTSKLSYAQQQEKVTRYKYYYTVANVTDEQLLQQIIDEVNTNPAVQGCKYRLKPEKRMAEISFVYEEVPQKGEGDKSNSLPDVKKLIAQKGLTYNGFTRNVETITK